MKIYQIHCYGGEWEDAFDYIKYSYLSKEKAEQKLKELEKNEELSRKRVDKCQTCPWIWDYRKDKSELRNQTQEYCKDFKPCAYDEDDYYENDCENYKSSFDNYSYRIEEVEIIE